MAKKATSAFNAELLDELIEGRDPAMVLHSDGLMGGVEKGPGGAHAQRRD